MNFAKDKEIRKRAISAVKAVTAGAILFAGLSCGSDDGNEGPQWNIENRDAGSDAALSDAGGDVALSDANGSDVQDVQETRCNAQESTGECYEECHQDEDVDCCHQWGGELWDGQCAALNIGPSVPPRMPQ